MENFQFFAIFEEEGGKIHVIIVNYAGKQGIICQDNTNLFRFHYVSLFDRSIKPLQVKDGPSWNRAG